MIALSRPASTNLYLPRRLGGLVTRGAPVLGCPGVVLTALSGTALPGAMNAAVRRFRITVLSI